MRRPGHLDWVQSPAAANVTAHGGFDEHAATLQATLARSETGDLRNAAANPVKPRQTLKPATMPIQHLQTERTP